MERFIEYEEDYTDGSKTDEGVGYSAISWYWRSVKKPPNQASSYSDEATAIYDGGKERFANWEKRLILTDNLSTIQGINNNNKKPAHPTAKPTHTAALY
jgi:hypothetical protein